MNIPGVSEFPENLRTGEFIEYKGVNYVGDKNNKPVPFVHEGFPVINEIPTELPEDQIVFVNTELASGLWVGAGNDHFPTLPAKTPFPMTGFKQIIAKILNGVGAPLSIERIIKNDFYQENISIPVSSNSSFQLQKSNDFPVSRATSIVTATGFGMEGPVNLNAIGIARLDASNSITIINDNYDPDAQGDDAFFTVTYKEYPPAS